MFIVSNVTKQIVIVVEKLRSAQSAWRTIGTVSFRRKIFFQKYKILG